MIRGLVGVGEASYSTIAPTIISDLFAGKMRSRMLGFFYFAIPVGSGLGFIIGSAVAKAAGGWWWALRVRMYFPFNTTVSETAIPFEYEYSHFRYSHEFPAKSLIAILCAYFWF